jgi:hypothetical protein
MIKLKQVVGAIVGLLCIIVGAVIIVDVNILLGGVLVVIGALVMLAGLAGANPGQMLRFARASPLRAIALILFFVGVIIMAAASSVGDIGDTIVGLVLFMVGLLLLVRKARAPQPVGGGLQPQVPASLLTPPPVQVNPQAVPGQYPAVPQYAASAYPPAVEFPPPPPPTYPPGRENVPPPPPPPLAERYCPSCGMGNARVAAFCGKCGKPLPPPH